MAYSLAEGAAEVEGVSDYFSKYGQVHGADTDVDGIPDGWELYVGADPLAADADGDDDNDGLNCLAEFVGTDSCQAYTNCVTLTAILSKNGTSMCKPTPHVVR